MRVMICEWRKMEPFVRALELPDSFKGRLTLPTAVVPWSSWLVAERRART